MQNLGVEIEKRRDPRVIVIVIVAVAVAVAVAVPAAGMSGLVLREICVAMVTCNIGLRPLRVVRSVGGDLMRAVSVWLRHPSTVDATCASGIDSCA